MRTFVLAVLATLFFVAAFLGMSWQLTIDGVTTEYTLTIGDRWVEEAEDEDNSTRADDQNVR